MDYVHVDNFDIQPSLGYQKHFRRLDWRCPAVRPPSSYNPTRTDIRALVLCILTQRISAALPNLTCYLRSPPSRPCVRLGPCVPSSYRNFGNS